MSPSCGQAVILAEKCDENSYMLIDPVENQLPENPMDLPKSSDPNFSPSLSVSAAGCEPHHKKSSKCSAPPEVSTMTSRHCGVPVSGSSPSKKVLKDLPKISIDSAECV